MNYYFYERIPLIALPFGLIILFIAYGVDRMNTIDKILLADVISLIIFTITMIVIFCVYQTVPDTLIQCFFGCAGGEGIITFAIWWVKKRHSKDDKK